MKKLQLKKAEFSLSLVSLFLFHLLSLFHSLLLILSHSITPLLHTHFVWLGTHYADPAGLDFTKICLLLPPEC